LRSSSCPSDQRAHLEGRAIGRCEFEGGAILLWSILALVILTVGL
jgi:hypothetical protein